MRPPQDGRSDVKLETQRMRTYCDSPLSSARS
jgi:hypothetical protein